MLQLGGAFATSLSKVSVHGGLLSPKPLRVRMRGQVDSTKHRQNDIEGPCTAKSLSITRSAPRGVAPGGSDSRRPVANCRSEARPCGPAPPAARPPAAQRRSAGADTPDCYSCRGFARPHGLLVGRGPGSEAAILSRRASARRRARGRAEHVMIGSDVAVRHFRAARHSCDVPCGDV